MRKYNLNEEVEKILTPNIVNLVPAIHEYKGKQTLYIEANPDILSTLLNVAKIQSTKFSNNIEGINSTDKRISELINDKVAPKKHNEEEIASYRDVLELINENYENIDITPNIIMKLILVLLILYYLFQFL